jgi:hypothetical protein
MKHDFETFVVSLEKELVRRHQECEDFSATPSSILLAMLNAVAAARINSVLAATDTKAAAPTIETEAEQRAKNFLARYTCAPEGEAIEIIRALLAERKA